MRLRDIAATLGISERNAQSIVTDLVDGGCVLKSRDGRRNRYQIQAHRPLHENIGRKRTIGDVLDLLAEADTTVVLQSEGTAVTTTQSPSSLRVGRGNTSTAGTARSAGL